MRQPRERAQSALGEYVRSPDAELLGRSRSLSGQDKFGEVPDDDLSAL